MLECLFVLGIMGVIGMITLGGGAYVINLIFSNSEEQKVIIK